MMADTDPVNFSMGAARQIRESVRVTQRLAHNERGRGRRWPIPEDSIPGMERVVFIVDSYDAVTGVATCTIMYRPCGLSAVTGEVNGQIEVIDAAGCYFEDEASPEYSLPGRWGHADLMVADGDSYAECVWVVSGLCCPV